jgi:hypothetical protein
MKPDEMKKWLWIWKLLWKEQETLKATRNYELLHVLTLWIRFLQSLGHIFTHIHAYKQTKIISEKGAKKQREEKKNMKLKLIINPRHSKNIIRSSSPSFSSLPTQAQLAWRRSKRSRSKEMKWWKENNWLISCVYYFHLLQHSSISKNLLYHHDYLVNNDSSSSIIIIFFHIVSHFQIRFGLQSRNWRQMMKIRVERVKCHGQKLSHERRS